MFFTNECCSIVLFLIIFYTFIFLSNFYFNDKDIDKSNCIYSINQFNFLGSYFLTKKIINRGNYSIIDSNRIYHVVVSLLIVLGILFIGYLILAKIIKDKTEKLKESENKFFNLAEVAPIAIMIYQDDKWIFVNKNAIDITGYSKEELLNMKFWEIVNDEYRDKVKKRGKKRQKGINPVDNYEFKINTKNGETKWVYLHGTSIKFQGKSAGLISVIDITKMKEYEKQLEKKEQRLELALEGGELGMWDWNIKTNEIIFNRQWAGMLGYSIEEIDNDYKTWADRIHPADRDWVMRELNKHLNGDTRLYKTEHRLKSKSGNWIWILDKGKVVSRDKNNDPIRMVGTHMDITEKKITEKKIENVRLLLENITNSMPSALITVDENCNISYWNKRAEKRLNLDENMKGKPITKAITYYKNISDDVINVIKNNKIMENTNISRKINENKIFEDIIIYPLKKNGISGAVVRIDDVTEKRMLQERVIQSEKMMAVGGLASGLAHEINNPLAAILGNIEVLSKRLDKEEKKNIEKAEKIGVSFEKINEYLKNQKVFRLIRNIKNSSKRAANIVKNILEFGYEKDTGKKNINIEEVLDKTVKVSKNDFDFKKNYDIKNIEFVKEYSGISKIKCDKSKLQQVFMNLIKNSAYATAQKKDTESRIILRTSEDKDFVKIELEDNGIGIDNDTQGRIFEPFFSTKAVGAGSGLGLSISYFIITEVHDGQMNVESEKNKGTKFIIKLPKT